ncbi:M24 family metallopeptidase [Natrialbaceae archaeon GCM10025810]|uniref:M24 family metallopeptidase n=1 Tax=Halovalidus salilacus TaxID=3075124 RepID=UPI0036167988
METERLERLSSYLEARDLESVWLARPNAFAWLTGGDNVVDRAADAGVAAIGYDGSDLHLVTDTIEAERILAEELPDLRAADGIDVDGGQGFRLETYPWYEATLAEALAEYAPKPAAADIDVPDREFETVDPTPLRQPLTETDVERYRDLARETAAAVEAVCRELLADDMEYEVASALSVALTAREIEAPVVLVGGSERATEYRHYTPTHDELGDYALVSVTTQRHGLCASCTRTVAFDPPGWLEERHEAAARVETSALAATKTAAAKGETAGDVFGEIQEAYAALGWKGEWERHHQGGAAGFAGREWIATPDHDAPVATPMAYAWNPTVQGAKSEGTVLVTDDGFEPLTDTGNWPTITARAVDADVELERPGILDADSS